MTRCTYRIVYLPQIAAAGTTKCANNYVTSTRGDVCVRPNKVCTYKRFAMAAISLNVDNYVYVCEN